MKRLQGSEALEVENRHKHDPIKCALSIVFAAMWIVTVLLFHSDWIMGERISILAALVGSTVAFLATLHWLRVPWR